MVDRLQAAAAARRDRSFVIMARTDAFASEGLDAALKRAQAYIDAGADMLFPEALTHIDHFKAYLLSSLSACSTHERALALIGTRSLTATRATQVHCRLPRYARAGQPDRVWTHAAVHSGGAEPVQGVDGALPRVGIPCHGTSDAASLRYDRQGRLPDGSHSAHADARGALRRTHAHDPLLPPHSVRSRT
jgi:hypothetical protein